VLWALVVILLLRGLASVVRPAPEPLAPAPSPEATAIRDDEARAYAAAFAKRYLTYDVARPDERERWLAPYLAEDLDPAGGVEIPEVGSNQRVEDTAKDEAVAEDEPPQEREAALEATRRGRTGPRRSIARAKPAGRIRQGSGCAVDHGCPLVRSDYASAGTITHIADIARQVART